MSHARVAAPTPAPAPAADRALDAAPHPAPRTLHRAALPALPLESGKVLRTAEIAYHLDGRLSAARDNVVLVLHALTGDADAAEGWWRGLIGPGAALDTARYAVLAPNLLGSCYGSTGPSHAAARFPAITTRDIARALGVLLEQLGIPRVALVTGGSLGGMVALEFAASFPGRAARAVVFAAPAEQGDAAIGWGHVQRELIGALGADGLALARRVAMLTYRTPEGLARRFRRAVAPEGGFAVESWLRAHGARLAQRFSVESYLTLLDAMDAHDVGRGRGSVGERLRASGTCFTGVGIPGDALYPDAVVRAWVDAAGARYRAIDSVHGHDAFLLERQQVGAILREALGSAREGEVAA
jgi:homoserine O-acetyltransferase